MKSKSDEKLTPHVSRGNVLDDLGFSPEEALELRVKADIYRELLAYIQSKGLTQQELGETLNIHQPDVSNLLNGRVSKFSVGKLIKFAGKLNLGAKVSLIEPAKLRIRKASTIKAGAKTQKKSAVLT
jgi:predicted XRE-type DNA-binding protein